MFFFDFVILKEMLKIYSRYFAWFLFFLIFQLIIRTPSFFEPYWYGDEAIYLSIGQSLNQGEILYKDIIDHKTPVIYYLAQVGTQLNLRLSLVLIMAIASTSFFFLIKIFTDNKNLSLVFALFFTFLTAMPAYEGLIFNGELIVMTLVFLGLVTLFFGKIKTNRDFFENTLLKPSYRLFFSGIFFSLATLTKVPAIMDFFAVLVIGWFYFFDQFFLFNKRKTRLSKSIILIGRFWLWMGLGYIIPILLSIIWFFYQGALSDYLEYGLLYSVRYSQSWIPAHLTANNAWLSSLPFKASLVSLFIILMSVLGKFWSSKLRFGVSWLLFALFASLLSNRPYPHYFLQVIPPLLLVISVSFNDFIDFFKKKNSSFPNFSLISTTLVIILVFFAHWLVEMKQYDTFAYYQRFTNLITNNISVVDYRNSFDSLVNSNYEVLSLLKAQENASLEIWGTNPTLYAMSGISPSSRFTVGFHVKDFQAEEEVLSLIKNNSPKFLVIMKNEEIPFALTQIINEKYKLIFIDDKLQLFKLK